MEGASDPQCPSADEETEFRPSGPGSLEDNERSIQEATAGDEIAAEETRAILDRRHKEDVDAATDQVIDGWRGLFDRLADEWGASSQPTG